MMTWIMIVLCTYLAISGLMYRGYLLGIEKNLVSKKYSDQYCINFVTYFWWTMPIIDTFKWLWDVLYGVVALFIVCLAGIVGCAQDVVSFFRPKA